MDITQLYKIYLKPGMLPPDKLVQVTIEAVTVEELHIRPGETKQAVVLSLKGKQARLILNQGNANRLAVIAGTDTDAWPGVVIGLKRAKYGPKETILICEPPKNGNGK